MDLEAALKFATNALSNAVFVIDTATNTVIAAIPDGLFPVGIAITPDGARAYVANQGSTISIINTTTNSVIATIPASFLVNYIAITPDGTRAYATSEQGFDAAVLVIDTATNSVITTIPVLRFAFRIAIGPAPRSPRTKEQCKNGGWRNFGPSAGPSKIRGSASASSNAAPPRATELGHVHVRDPRGHRREIVMKEIKVWRPVRDSNPCCRRERAMS